MCDTWLSLSGQAEANMIRRFLVLFFKKEPLSATWPAAPSPTAKRLERVVTRP